MAAKEPKNDRPTSVYSSPDHFSQDPDATASKANPVFPGLSTPWEEFQHPESKRLSRIAAKTGLPPEKVEEVVQEVWLDAWKHRQGFQGRDVDQRLASWLGKVVLSKSRNALRRMKYQQAVTLDTLPAEPVDVATEEPAELMETAERDMCLKKTYEELGKKEPLNCHLLWERIVEGRSIRDLATETGLGYHAISCRINRTLRKLGTWLCELVPDRNASVQSAQGSEEKKMKNPREI